MNIQTLNAYSNTINQAFLDNVTSWEEKKGIVQKTLDKIKKDLDNTTFPTIEVVETIAYDALRFWVLSIISLGIYTIIFYARQATEIKKSEQDLSLKLQCNELISKTNLLLAQKELEYIDEIIDAPPSNDGTARYITLYTNDKKNKTRELLVKFKENNEEIDNIKLSVQFNKDELKQILSDYEKDESLYEALVKGPMQTFISSGQIENLTEISENLNYLTDLEREFIYEDQFNETIADIIELVEKGNSLIPKECLVFNDSSLLADDPTFAPNRLAFYNLIAFRWFLEGKMNNDQSALIIDKKLPLYPTQKIKVLKLNENFEYSFVNIIMHRQPLLDKVSFDPIKVKKLFDSISKNNKEDMDLLFVWLLEALIPDENETLKTTRYKLENISPDRLKTLKKLKEQLEILAGALERDYTFANLLRGYAQNNEEALDEEGNPILDENDDPKPKIEPLRKEPAKEIESKAPEVQNWDIENLDIPEELKNAMKIQRDFLKNTGKKECLVNPLENLNEKVLPRNFGQTLDFLHKYYYLTHTQNYTNNVIEGCLLSSLTRLLVPSTIHNPAKYTAMIRESMARYVEKNPEKFKAEIYTEWNVDVPTYIQKLRRQNHERLATYLTYLEITIFAEAMNVNVKIFTPEMELKLENGVPVPVYNIGPNTDISLFLAYDPGNTYYALVPKIIKTSENQEILDKWEELDRVGDQDYRTN